MTFCGCYGNGNHILQKKSHYLPNWTILPDLKCCTVKNIVLKFMYLDVNSFNFISNTDTFVTIKHTMTLKIDSVVEVTLQQIILINITSPRLK